MFCSADFFAEARRKKEKGEPIDLFPLIASPFGPGLQPDPTPIPQNPRLALRFYAHSFDCDQ